MALDISGANIGFDANNIQALFNDIQTNLVDETCNSLNNNFKNLQESLDSIWQGQSEKIFLANMHADVEKIINAVTDAGERLKTEINNAGAEMVHIDQELVKPRS